LLFSSSKKLFESQTFLIALSLSFLESCMKMQTGEVRLISTSQKLHRPDFHSPSRGHCLPFPPDAAACIPAPEATVK